MRFLPFYGYSYRTDIADWLEQKKKILSKEAKEEVEEDNKSMSSFVRKKEELDEGDDDNKPIKSALSGSLPNPMKKEIVEGDDKKLVSSAGVLKALGGQFQTKAGRKIPFMLTKDSGFVLISYMKVAFHHEPATYQECVKVFADFKARRLDGAGTLARLAELMKDHGDLLRAYSVLFPKANITVPPEAYQALGPFQTITGTSVSRKNKEASLYMASVKEAFDDEPAKYKEFLKVLKDVRARRIDVASAIVVVEKLMKDNRDLFRGVVVVFAAKPTIIIPPEGKQKIEPDEYKRKLVDPSNGADFMNKRQTRSQSRSRSRRDTDAA